MGTDALPVLLAEGDQTARARAQGLAGGARMTGAIKRLRRQHEQILAAFQELEITAEPEQRIVLLAHVGLRLKAHAAAEEAVFYGAVEGAADGQPVERARAAHLAIDALLDEILGADADGERAAELCRLVERHFADEERELFPLAERLGAAARAALDQRLDEYLAAHGDGSEDAVPLESGGTQR